MNKCPNCKARYRSTTPTHSCRRCGMDLSWLIKIHENAEALQHHIIQALIKRKYDEAGKLLEQYQQLKSTTHQMDLIKNFIDYKKSLKDYPIEAKSKQDTA